MRTTGLKRIDMTSDERAVLEKLAAMSGQDTWFSIADRSLDWFQKKRLKRPFMFDRVYDKADGKCAEAYIGVGRLDAALSGKHISALTDAERTTYGRILDKLEIDSPNAVSDSGSLFRQRGNTRRCHLWYCMDDLILSLRKKHAIAKWTEEGYPKAYDGRGSSRHIQSMDEFRNCNLKPELTEEEFDRISRVFVECLND